MTGSFLLPLELVVDPTQATTTDEAAALAASFAKRHAGYDDTAHGRSVLLVLLESTHSDDWSDPEWRPASSAGEACMLPRAIANYPRDCARLRRGLRRPAAICHCAEHAPASTGSLMACQSTSTIWRCTPALPRGSSGCGSVSVEMLKDNEERAGSCAVLPAKAVCPYVVL